MSAQFEDGKDEGALRTIGEVSRALGIKTHVLRYWEQQFPMLDPLKRSGGRRYYRSEDVDLIERINQLVNDEGYTLKGAQQVIESGKGEAKGVGASGDTGGQGETDPLAGETGNSSAIPAELPSAADGGVDAFFGRDSYADTKTDSAPEEVVPSSLDLDEQAEVEIKLNEEGPSRAAILAQLKSIRIRLADALAA
ncbi:hypothetical protein GCM10023115_13120 [Pontixanthobacter gangjinensis]|uniref:MerR family transcriptional regulator n=1 Tax=Pontixanthobacter gangjinensis TaxID=1028742 RepID=A0A6I4SN31_9SPHN|nr:MerR family transcriptional regulator [Pontixanthobacter gangjinensis]MXO56556.1 MerR family transcriptional regulator [Pontixanthobacter gangjinensis]